MDAEQNPLVVEKANYKFTDNYTVLELVINGKIALIGDVKKALLDLGYVYLISSTIGFNWEDVLPDKEVTVDDESADSPMTLTGCTDDPVIVQLTRDYWDAINELNGKVFKEGPVKIPPN